MAIEVHGAVMPKLESLTTTFSLSLSLVCRKLFQEGTVHPWKNPLEKASPKRGRTMKRTKIYQLLLWCAIEYCAGYEFPVWRNGQWKTSAQYKLEAFKWSIRLFLMAHGWCLMQTEPTQPSADTCPTSTHPTQPLTCQWTFGVGYSLQFWLWVYCGFYLKADRDHKWKSTKISKVKR
jgi:hypothetical protein